MRTPMERGARLGGNITGGDTLNRPEPIAPEEPEAR